MGIYERLKEAGVQNIRGFSVPQMRRFDGELCVIEMSIVTRPFVLDFAGAYLDAPPAFSDEVWEQWEKDKREQYEGRWPEVQVVLTELERFDIHMIDISSTNIAFVD